MTELLTALVTLLDFITVYLNEADDDATFPYMIMSSSVAQDYTFSEDFESFLVQFDIYSSDSSSKPVNVLFGQLKTHLDKADFAVTSYIVDQCQREGPASLLKWRISGVPVWDFTVTYRILLRKT